MDFSLLIAIGRGIFWLTVCALILAFGALLFLARQEHSQAPISWVEAIFKAITQRR